VKDLLAGRIALTGLDLAYTAGLYDYLPTRLARSVTAALFSMVSAGGRVAVANCAPNWDAMAYMEAFMDWRLIYRAESEMTELAASIPGREIDEMRLFRNPSGNVVFLEIVRRAH
jgi:extracellular factor (EF) 3-hydroxypalmitic acid methyl ester biosynthesis protein